NAKKTDYFLEVLRAHRPDLAGLPFITGDACRLSKDRSKDFANVLLGVRASLAEASLGIEPFALPPKEEPKRTPENSRAFWSHLRGSWQKEDKQSQRKISQGIAAARVAALMQVLGPEPPEMSKGLVQYLAETAHPDATRALARLAVFST